MAVNDLYPQRVWKTAGTISTAGSYSKGDVLEVFDKPISEEESGQSFYTTSSFANESFTIKHVT